MLINVYSEKHIWWSDMKKFLVPAVVIAVVIVIMVFSLKKEQDSGLTLGTLQAEASESGMPMVIQFTTDSCIVCRKMEPALNKVESESDGRYKFKKIDVGINTGIAIELGINAVPVQLFISSEGEVVDRHLGYLSYKDFSEIFAKHSF